jgi:hypothetical protein
LKKIAKTVSKTKMTIFLHQIHSESQKHVHLTTRTANYKYLGKNVKNAKVKRNTKIWPLMGLLIPPKSSPGFSKVAQMVKFCPIWSHWSLTHRKIS